MKPVALLASLASAAVLASPAVASAAGSLPGAVVSTERPATTHSSSRCTEHTLNWDSYTRVGHKKLFTTHQSRTGATTADP